MEFADSRIRTGFYRTAIPKLKKSHGSLGSSQRDRDDGSLHFRSYPGAEMMFVDYYEILESSPNAHPSTIDQLFICLAKRFHPDVPNSGDKQKFAKIAEAYQTLRIPASRDQYDAKYSSEHGKSKAPVNGSHEKASDAIEVDVADRHELLALFYKKRRDNIDDPGLAVGGIEHQVDYPLNVLKFHLWYCTQKGWLHREESGQLAITSAGVDKMESTVTMNALNATKHLLTPGV